MGFGESAKKCVEEALFFCQVDDAPLLPLSLDRFPPNFSRTRVQVVARDTWFHIPEKFPLRDRISRKTVFFQGTLGYPVCAQRTGHAVTGNVLRRLGCFVFPTFHPLVDIPQIYPPWVSSAEGCTVFQLSTSERLSLPRCQQWRKLDAYICFKHTRQGAPRSDRRFALVHYSSAYFLVASLNCLQIVHIRLILHRGPYKRRATLFRTITSVFLDEFLHFLYHWKQE